MAHELSAGVARVDITPPVGISMAGFYVREGVSTGIERPLTATAVVLSNGSVKVAIVACDLIFLQSPDVDRLRGKIGAALGTSGDKVLLNFSTLTVVQRRRAGGCMRRRNSKRCSAPS